MVASTNLFKGDSTALDYLQDPTTSKFSTIPYSNFIPERIQHSTMKKDPTTVVPPTTNVGHMDGGDPIAVIGFALKFPQDVTSEENLWKVLMEKRTTMTDVPANRWNLDGFYKPHGNRPGTVCFQPSGVMDLLTMA
jgi:hypothetical protein